ncbi:hypothetical protein [Roseovarius pelagicus]|uniref:2',3'-cyclic-nucleotide 2'-phosphodiesterase / 3'-nucleotidase n=1 Tax=Roseovarius pelagicus TaxID=2980108 RepID=A0ABY6DGF7_9RHOB|nr:hypothetical protein [Roseovarius pelagicus]UXX84600.1 hypothetical protein N7U68_08170 [Roseovarius pelagicus]
MSTTDLHANLLPYDYYADKGDQPYGLARTATLIRAARAEASNVMLFDNGDACRARHLATSLRRPTAAGPGTTR